MKVRHKRYALWFVFERNLSLLSIAISISKKRAQQRDLAMNRRISGTNLNRDYPLYMNVTKKQALNCPKEVYFYELKAYRRR